MKKIALLLIILTAAASCTRHEAPEEAQNAQWWGFSIHTIQAKQDTLNGNIGLCVTNDVLQYTPDSLTIQFLEKQHYNICNNRFDGDAVWVMRGHTFTRMPVTCGESDSTRTLITHGLKEGEAVVADIHVSQKP